MYHIFSLPSGLRTTYAQQVRIWGSYPFKQAFSQLISFRPKFSCHTGVPGTLNSWDFCGFLECTGLYFYFPQSQFRIPSFESVTIPIFLPLSLSTYAQNESLFTLIQQFQRVPRAGEHLYSIHHIKLEVIYPFFSLGVFIFYFYFIKPFKIRIVTIFSIIYYQCFFSSWNF